MGISRRATTFAISLLACALAGCFSSILAPRPEAVHFYILDAAEPAANARNTWPKPNAIIGLGPINFPDYLARSEIVRRTADNQIQLSSNERWAEPLDVTFKRVLAIDLSRALDGAQIISFPWFGGLPPNSFRIEATIDRFEADDEGVAHLAARWSLLDAAGKVRNARTSSIDVPSSANDTAAIATALSEATSQFAAQMASVAGPVISGSTE